MLDNVYMTPLSTGERGFMLVSPLLTMCRLVHGRHATGGGDEEQADDRLPRVPNRRGIYHPTVYMA